MLSSELGTCGHIFKCPMLRRCRTTVSRSFASTFFDATSKRRLQLASGFDHLPPCLRVHREAMVWAFTPGVVGEMFLDHSRAERDRAQHGRVPGRVVAEARVI